MNAAQSPNFTYETPKKLVFWQPKQMKSNETDWTVVEDFACVYGAHENMNEGADARLQFVDML